MWYDDALSSYLFYPPTNILHPFPNPNFCSFKSLPVCLSNAANIGERKTWTYSEFYTEQNCTRGQEPQKCIHNEPHQEMAKHRANFGWPPVSLSDVAGVMKARRDTHWLLPWCPKLWNRSQPWVGRSSPYCGDMWYCCLWSPYVIGRPYIFSSCSFFPSSSSFFSSPNLSGRRLDVYHTSTHGVALVRI